MTQFYAYGDSALLINFEQKIAPEINACVITLQHLIEAGTIPGIRFCIPAYCSLTIGYDPMLVHYDQLCKQIEEILSSNLTPKELPTERTLRIPVCYEEPYALDVAEVSRQTKLSPKEIIDLHTSTPFRVYMLGFLPGFAYMGRLPDALFCSRKTTPRLRVPAQSVGLAGYQTGIYPSEAPGGWQIIGRTPLTVFSAEQENPFLFQAGDKVYFYAVSVTDLENMEKEIASGNFKLSDIYE